MPVGPYDFTVNIPNPGEAFIQSFQMAQQQRQAQNRQQRYAQWVGRLQQDRSPETMASFMLEFPEMSDAITKAFGPMDQARKEAKLGFYGQALSALDRGDTEMAKRLVEERLTAARNTIGGEQEAKELEYGLSLADSNPDALRAGLASTIYSLDPKRYEALYKKDTEKPYVAVPGVGLFLRRDIDAAIAAGERGTSNPSVRPRIPEQAIADLRKNPSTAAQFDEVFGPGAAAAALGMGGVPAPATDANGMPATLTRAQYDAVVNVKGKAATDDWMRRNNITLGGQ